MSTPHEIYTERSQQFARTRDEYARRSNRLSNLRLALFLGAIGLAALAVAHTPWWWLGVAALSVMFVVAVARHHDVERLRRQPERAQKQRQAQIGKAVGPAGVLVTGARKLLAALGVGCLRGAQ